MIKDLKRAVSSIQPDTFIAVVIIIVIYYIYFRPLKPVGVQGETFRKWNVVGSYDNHTEAAQAFSRLNDKMIKLGRHLQKKYKI